MCPVIYVGPLLPHQDESHRKTIYQQIVLQFQRGVTLQDNRGAFQHRVYNWGTDENQVSSSQADYLRSHQLIPDFHRQVLNQRFPVFPSKVGNSIEWNIFS